MNPKSYVLDASIAVSWFIPGRDYSTEADQLLCLILSGDVVAFAPQYMIIEFHSALSKEFRQMRKSIDDLNVAISRFWDIPVQYVDIPRDFLQKTASRSVRFQKSFYDMGYFLLGEQRSLPVCTLDTRSISGLPKEFPCELIHLPELFSSR
jgi:predicted nucleic acid-binding protein